MKKVLFWIILVFLVYQIIPSCSETDEERDQRLIYEEIMKRRPR